ncbi:hypothetical protein OJ997_05480 [Solirubrobacter phytolaccae]|uniref:Serine dehydrogenasease n=1 Tax=Solirubrobacter phytolaccae TaxID=1404360 RepID=A0A9X3S9Y3_9ACTN|nr:hypothetical protein [Solirubrobacter phytolaccae]MDA0179735.1 hypothetical protein [Solirubrobacter phytolaccae]
MSATEVAVAERDSNRIIELQLSERAELIEKASNADFIAYLGPMFPPADDQIKDVVEAVSPRRPSLLILLETGGGFVSVSERVARIFRHHYERVEFIVPSHAMSAGTVLVMSGDAIHMDYASVLGPIDPQIPKNGNLVPALGYLEQFERLIKKSEEGNLTTAELAYLLQNFDPAELYRYEQERELSIALLEDWLVNFKFKNWTTTEGAGVEVTEEMRRERAQEVGRKLNETGRWHSHNRGIPMEVLRRDLKLLIEDFGANDALRGPVHDYYRLLKDYAMRRTHDEGFVLHTKESYVGF